MSANQIFTAIGGRKNTKTQAIRAGVPSPSPFFFIFPPLSPPPSPPFLLKRLLRRLGLRECSVLRQRLYFICLHGFLLPVLKNMPIAITNRISCKQSSQAVSKACRDSLVLLTSHFAVSKALPKSRTNRRDLFRIKVCYEGTRYMY